MKTSKRTNNSTIATETPTRRSHQRIVRPLVGDEWEYKRPGKQKLVKTIGKIYVARNEKSKDDRGRVRARKWRVDWKRQPKGRYTGTTVRALLLYGRRIQTAAEWQARIEAIRIKREMA